MYFMIEDPLKIYHIQDSYIDIVARIQMLESEDIAVMNSGGVKLFAGTLDEARDFIYGLGGFLGAANLKAGK